VDGPARVVLVGDGGAEERHDAVAEELVDRALVAVHLGQHEVEGAAHEPMHFLGVEALGQRGEPRDVHEEHRHLLALALEGAAGGQNFLGEVLRRIRLWRREAAGRDAGLERPAALVAKPVAGRVWRLTRSADNLEARAAAAAEADTFGILVAAARTGHHSGAST